ncbi:hypothetical protein Droror1_Dr00024049 [Drosera rotundifolia]
MDMTTQNLDFSFPGSGKILGNSNDVEAEMRRLRLELKQTMDMYKHACKEAISPNEDIMDDNVYMEPSTDSASDSSCIDGRVGEGVVPIHLDVFRGDVSLFKQLLSSYKLPFFKKEPKQKRATDSKFQRLSYHAMDRLVEVVGGGRKKFGDLGRKREEGREEAEMGAAVKVGALIQSSKIALGLSYYGQALELINGSIHGYGAQASGPAITTNGFVTYADIEAFAVKNGATTTCDPTVGKIYSYSWTTWIAYDDPQAITYDDPQAIATKVAFVK